MKLLTVEHSTIYRYNRPVRFGEHRLMFRPRDSHDMRLISTGLRISPTADIRWLHDVFNNSIAIATFDEMSDRLEFVSTITLEHYGGVYPDLTLTPYARIFPFTYTGDEMADLGRTVERHYEDPEQQILEWARQFMNREGETNTYDMLIAMNSAINAQFGYSRRYDLGTQPPLETLHKGNGSCRDFALLMMEAVRSLGLAARFVSGYLYDPSLDGGDESMVGAGETHAWVQVYLPGAGWVEFDPTNGLIGGGNLVRVAVARDPSQAIPLQGSFFGGAEDFIDMEVKVSVTARHRALTRAAS
ncbi:MAG: transglutaminase family protein [Alphaproteobacteria bacterium]|nr:transglutaminase family protein [Alphaproteobacteria bacterium]MBU0796185.1 transglutaminase family protein [Alphaproteobacteria bacterium]MBU0887199.1 transglutaminase family protein [Alphaproteobacteria bacterium]MBU1812273.1 transglutaminase family protein [Alphaproteobacteria bacterium]